MRHKSNESGQNVLPDKVSGLKQTNFLLCEGDICRNMESTDQFEYTKHSIDMPTLVRCKTLGSQADLGRHSKFKFVIGNFEESEEFPNEYPDVLLVYECV